MELKQLQFLVACADTQSFSKAANLLYTAQSNVSKVIKSLEEELGTELFERKQHGIVLTDKGRQIYRYAVTTLENAQRIVDFARLESMEELHISCNPSSWMADAFCDYYKMHGREEISYYVMTCSTNDIIRRLAGDIDQLGFVYVMEAQLSMLQSKIERNHINFMPLINTKAMLYVGEGFSKKRGFIEKDRLPENIALVQGYEDEFTPNAYWNEELTSERGTNAHRVAVTTNSDYLMRVLLDNTDLGNISGGYLSGEDRAGCPSISLYEEETPVIFGCLFRNDRNLKPLELHYLNYIRERL